MVTDGHPVALLTGDLQTEQRHAVIERFRDGKEKVLITTNVSARGETSGECDSHTSPFSLKLGSCVPNMQTTNGKVFLSSTHSLVYT